MEGIVVRPTHVLAPVTDVVSVDDRQNRQIVCGTKGVDLTRLETQLLADEVGRIVIVPDPLAADSAPGAVHRSAVAADVRIPDFHTAGPAGAGAATASVVHAAEADRDDRGSADTGERDREVEHISAAVRVRDQQLATPAVGSSRLLDVDLAADGVLCDLSLNGLAALRHHEVFIRKDISHRAGRSRLAGAQSGDVPRLIVDVSCALVGLTIQAGGRVRAVATASGAPVTAVLHPQTIVLKEEVVVSVNAHLDVDGMGVAGAPGADASRARLRDGGLADRVQKVGVGARVVVPHAVAGLAAGGDNALGTAPDTSSRLSEKV